MKKNTVLTIVLAIVIVAVIGGSVLAYRSLSGKIATPTDTPAVTADSSSNGTEPANEKDAAPDITVYDGSGNAVTLAEQRGKPVVINFWATWCPPCKSELPHFDKLYQEYGDRVEFMMVDLTDGGGETAENTKAFLEENGYTFPVYYDDEGSATAAYRISSIPLTVLLDADGNAADSHLGAMDEATLRTYIESLIAA